MVFKRGGNTNRNDKAGLIRVRIVLDNNDKDHKGNISKALTVRDAKVSEVTKAIELALFGEDNQ